MLQWGWGLTHATKAQREVSFASRTFFIPNRNLGKPVGSPSYYYGGQSVA